MNNGYVRLHRKIIDSSFYKDSRTVHLWIHLLTKANHKENKFLFNGSEVKVKRGQFITGRKVLELETGIEQSKIQRALKFFEKCKMIEQQTNNVSRLITICNWEDYQHCEQQMNNKRTTSEQRVNTNNNDKNDKNEKNIYSLEIDSIYSAYPPRCLISQRSTGKNAKDKDRIKKLLKDKTKDYMLDVIDLYTKDCAANETYMKNFGTFLNNFPSKEDFQVLTHGRYFPPARKKENMQ